MSSARPDPLFCGCDEQYFFTLPGKLANLHIFSKGDLQRFIKTLILTSVDKTGSRMIRTNIDAFRQIRIGVFP